MTICSSCVTSGLTHKEERSRAIPQDLDFDLSCQPTRRTESSRLLRLQGHIQMQLDGDTYVVNAPLSVYLANQTDIKVNEHFLTGETDRPDGALILEDGASSTTMTFRIDPQGRAQVDYGDQQSIAMNCSKSLTTIAKPLRTPSCNAQGTKAQGWYIGGKLIAYDSNCGSKVLRCGVFDGQQGWVIAHQEHHQLLKLGSCVNTNARCEGNPDKVRGWYIGAQLLQEDNNCHLSSIECSHVGTRKEGWYTYQQNNAALYQTGNCWYGRGKDALARK